MEFLGFCPTSLNYIRKFCALREKYNISFSCINYSPLEKSYGRPCLHTYPYFRGPIFRYNELKEGQFILIDSRQLDFYNQILRPHQFFKGRGGEADQSHTIADRRMDGQTTKVKNRGVCYAPKKDEVC